MSETDEHTPVADRPRQTPPPLPKSVPHWFQLFDTRDGMRRYILRAWLLGLIPSLAIGTLLASAGLMTETPGSDVLEGMGTGQMLLLTLVLAPVGETLLLSATLGLLGLFVKSRPGVLAASTCIWALFHLPNGPLIPLVIAWPFFVFGAAYLAWRPQGWLRAVVVVTAIHLLQNLLPALAFLAYDPPS